MKTTLTYLYNELRTKDDVRGLFLHLLVDGYFFDMLNEDPREILNFRHERLFNEHEVRLLNKRTNEIFKIYRNYPEECPLGFVLEFKEFMSNYND